ncbi:hypothetical protein ACHAPQ_008629 [Fusarium lateritium]
MSGLEFLSLAIAIPGLVQTFIHASRYLSKKIKSLQNASEINRIHDFLLTLDHGTIRLTLENIEDLCCDTNDETERAHIKSSAQYMLDKLKDLNKEIEKLIDIDESEKQDEKRKKKAREAALAIVDSVENIASKLQGYVQAHLGQRQLKLRSRLEFRPNQFCCIGQPARLPHSPTAMVEGDFGGQVSGLCILEEKVYPDLDPGQAYDCAKDLARTLQTVKSSGEGLLELAGFQVMSSPSRQAKDRFRFVFHYPEKHMNGRSLRDILLDPINQPRPPIPRNYRFILPKKLAETVYQVHRQNLVHKCIRPESILLFERAPGNTPELKYPKKIGAPYLVDWQHLRKTVEASKRDVSGHDWTMAMYQHPERQAPPGSVAEYKYNIGHDIYSLGVCFLEIGLWDSFVTHNENGQPDLSQLLANAKAQWKCENPGWQHMRDSQIEQQAFITLAKGLLAYEMGRSYSNLVVKCLLCIENGFGNILKFVDSGSTDWDEQGVLFIQEIRKELETASNMNA